MRTLAARCALVPLVLIGFAMPALADWPSQGRRIVGAGYETRGAWIFDLPSGDLLVRAAGPSTMTSHINAESVTPAGEIAPGWPAYGVGFGYFHSQQSPSSIGFAVDPNGFTWGGAGGDLEGTAYVVSPMGVLAPVTFAPTYSTYAPAPNGIYAFSSNRLLRFTQTGVAPGWPAGGVVVVANSGWLPALPDGSGGVVTMNWASEVGLRTQRVDSSGVKHAGTVLSTDVDAAQVDLVDPPLPALVPSDASHYFAVWSAPANPAVPQHVMVQRVNYAGALAPGWPTQGVVAGAPHTIFHVTPLSDHAGGLYIVWYQDDGLPRATHVRADGTFVPGTDANGVILFPPGPLREPQEGFDGGSLPYMVADVTPDGRLIFAWDDVASGNGIRVQWLLPDLTADPSEPADGRLILPNPEKTSVRAVHAAPDGGAYVAWNSTIQLSGYQTAGEIWMTRILPSALVGVAPRAHVALALSAPRPNPARGSISLDVTLPDDSPARVELLDVAGRVQWTRAVQGEGTRAIALEDLASLPPGLYFARVTHTLGSATSRVVVAR